MFPLSLHTTKTSTIYCPPTSPSVEEEYCTTSDNDAVDDDDSDAALLFGYSACTSCSKSRIFSTVPTSMRELNDAADDDDEDDDPVVLNI